MQLASSDAVGADAHIGPFWNHSFLSQKEKEKNGFEKQSLIFPMIQRAPELLGLLKDMRILGLLVDPDELTVFH